MALGAVIGAVVALASFPEVRQAIADGLPHVAWLVARDALVSWLAFGAALGLAVGLVRAVRPRAVRWGLTTLFTPAAVAAVGAFWFRARIRQEWLAFDGPDGRGTIDLGYIWWRAEVYRDLLIGVGVAVVVGIVGLAIALRFLDRRLAHSERSVSIPNLSAWTLVPLAVAAVLVAVPALRHRQLPAARDDAPNIILVSIDTLRSDRLGSYGSDKGLTPNLDAFADDALVFTSVFAQSAWTLTSHMSMLTSLYPAVHGVDEGVSLNPRVVTLAEALRNAGYDTRAVVRTVPWLEPKYGFNAGFQRYLIKNYTLDAAVQNEFVTDEIAGLGERPFFLFLHYFDVHSDFHRRPYDAPEPFYEAIAKPFETDFTGGYGDKFASDYLKYLNREKEAMPPDDLAYVAATYDAGVAYFDKCFGELLDILDDGLDLDNTWIVVTADHGEEFQDHGYMLHSNPRHHRELVHVPFMVRGPGTRPGRNDDLFELIDVPPTVLDLVGVDPVPGMQGISIANVLRGHAGGQQVKEYAFSELGPSASVTSRDFRLLVRPQLEVPYVLFNRHDDPFERRNVVDEHRDVASKMIAALYDRRRDEVSLAGGTVTLSESETEMLRSLGYLE